MDFADRDYGQRSHKMPIKINRFNDLNKLFSEGLVLNKRGGFAEDSIEDTESVSIADVWGWHLYARLRIGAAYTKSVDADAEDQLVDIYERFTNAAAGAVQIFGERVVLLEHQGEMLHFHLSAGENEKQVVTAFANVLAALVKEKVMPSEGAYGFSMAAQYGRSVILLVPSATKEESAYSRVSLGPNANSPAKKVIRNTATDDWTLALKNNEDGVWARVGVIPDFESVRRSTAKELFEKVANRFSARATACDSIEPVEQEAENAPISRYGYMFRADQDGFTAKVRAAFESGTEADVDRLVVSFLNFMKAARAWQEEGVEGTTIIVCPWAGDCCNMVVVPTGDEQESDADASRRLISSFPTKFVRAWEEFARENASEVASEWSYGMAEGRVKIFVKALDDHKYRLFVGWPVGVSLEAVNLETNNVRDLSMHKDDVFQMTVKVRDSYKKVNDSYYTQTGSSRDEVVKDMVKSAGAFARRTEYADRTVPPSRPYSDFTV